MTTSPTPLRLDPDPAPLRTPRQLAAVALAALSSLVLFLALSAMTAGPAGANEFEPDPAASMSAACVAANFGTDITVTMTNESGLADAHFTVDSYAYGPTSHVVAPGQTEQFVLDGVPDGASIGLTVTADFGVVNTHTFETDCWNYTGQLISVCDGAEAHLELHLVRTGELPGNVYIDVDGQTVASMWVEDVWDQSIPVPTGVPLDVVVGDNHDGMIFRYSDPVTCEVPEPTIPDTTVPSTVPDVPTTTPSTPSTGPLPAVLAAGVDAPAVASGVDAPAALAFTGRSTTLLAVSGVILLLAGIAVMVLGRRLLIAGSRSQG